MREHLEINAAPMVIQTDYRILPKITQFHFPEAADEGVAGEEVKKADREARGSSVRLGRRGSVDLVEQMRERAATNRTHIYIKKPANVICASYKAEKSIGDIHSFNLELPMLEYHKCVDGLNPCLRCN